jgi:hypothetical protein
MTAKKTIIIYDGDTLSYRASAATEERKVKVIHEPSGKAKVFKNRTECKAAITKAGREFDPVIYKFEDIQEPEPIANTCGIMKNQIQKTNDLLFADEYLLCLSGKSNMRDRLPLPSPYKGNRVDTLRPLNLKDAKMYLYKNHPCIVAQDREADDDLIIKGYEYLEKGYDVILASQDKDSRAYTGLTLYDFTQEVPTLEVMPSFGSLVDTGKKITGSGFIWFAMQWLNGDPTDNYKPSELSRTKFGEKGAYKLLQPAQNEKEAIEIVIRQYKNWYGNGVSYVDCFGEKRFVDHEFLLGLYYKCARMMSHENDKLDFKEMLDKYGVKL